MKVAPLITVALILCISFPGLIEAKQKRKFCVGKDGNRYEEGEGYEDKAACYKCIKRKGKFIMKSRKCVVDGEWSSWSSWSECSATCGRETKERERTCSSPAPNNGGNPCSGPEREIANCTNPSCGPDMTQWNLTELNVQSLNDSIQTLQTTMLSVLELITTMQSAANKQGTCMMDLSSADCPDSAPGKIGVVDGINTNKAGINTNKAGINTNKAGLTSTKTDINTNKAGINTNKAGINTNKAGIMENKDAIAAHHSGKSCKEIKNASPLSEDGIYDILPVGQSNPHKVYCEMTTDGGGWTVMAFLRSKDQWDYEVFGNNGKVGDIINGFSTGATLKIFNTKFTEKLIVYLALNETGVMLGKQWMINQRPDALSFSQIKTSYGWSYRDSFGYSKVDARNVCSHGCDEYRTFGLFGYAGGEPSSGYCGTQGNNYGCRDGNNICWVPRSLGCNVGDKRCALLSGDGEGVIYAVR